MGLRRSVANPLRFAGSTVKPVVSESTPSWVKLLDTKYLAGWPNSVVWWLECAERQSDGCALRESLYNQYCVY